MRRLQTRLAAATEFFSSEAIVRELARPAFDVFRKTGELPEDQHVAHEVVQRVLRGYDAFPNTGHPALDRQRALRDAQGSLGDLIHPFLLGESAMRSGEACLLRASRSLLP